MRLIVAVSAIGVAMLGAYQYELPASHFLNRYDSGIAETHIVAVDGRVRATGPFAYISGMAMMAGFSAWAGTFLTLPVKGRAQWVRLVGMGSIAAGFVCCAASMSRSGLFFWGATIIGGCFLYFRPKQILTVLFAMLLISPFIVGGSEDDEDQPAQSDSLTSGLAHRLEHADTFFDRATYMAQNLVQGVSKHPLGEGLGAGQPGGAYAAGKELRGNESEWGRIAFEVGPLGLAAVLFIRFATFRRCWQQLRLTTDDQTRLVLATSLPYFGLISLGWMAFNHTGNSFAWSVACLCLPLQLATVETRQSNLCRSATRISAALCDPPDKDV